MKITGKRYVHMTTNKLLSYPTLNWDENRIPEGKVIACDTETTGLNTYKGDRAFLFSFANEEGDVTVVPRTLENKEMLETFFADTSITKIFHNSKFDMKMCRKSGFPVKGRVEDTLVMSRLVDENSIMHKLKYLCKKYFDYKAVEDEQMDAYKKKNKIKTYEEIPTDILYPYAAVDAWNCMLLYHLFKEPISDMRKAYALDMNCVRYSMEVEDKGVLINKARATEIWKEEKADFDAIQKDLKKRTGIKLDPDNKRLLGYALFAAGEKCIKLSDKGEPVLDKKTLPKYKADFVPDFIEMKKKNKSAKEIKAQIIDNVDAAHVLHSNFNISMARTRRASSSQPNFQNINKKSKIREIFVCRPGHNLFYFDYSQIEYRLFAHFGRDAELIKGYCEGDLDAHDLTARRLKVDRDDIAKTLNFAVLYGSGANGLVDLLNKPYTFCLDLIQKFHAANPSLEELKYRLEVELLDKGYIEDPYGMHYHVLTDDIFKIVNTLIQGCAGSVLKKAKLNCRKLLKNHSAYMVGEIHDELIFEVPHNKEHIVPLIKEAMEDTTLEMFDIPLTVSVEYTKTNWGAKEEYPLEEMKKVMVPW